MNGLRVGCSGVLALVCFFIFEAACGIYWPSMGIIKSKYVPEEVRFFWPMCMWSASKRQGLAMRKLFDRRAVVEQVRATMYNVFRVPLNVIVVVVLANLGTVSDNSVLCICGFLLGAAALMHHLFESMVKESTTGAQADLTPDPKPSSDGQPLSQLSADLPVSPNSEIQPA